jgi:hypothetical protein
MAAGVPVLVMPIVVSVLMGMSHGLVAVLMPVMGMGLRVMGVLMLMFVLVVAAHGSSLLSTLFFINFNQLSCILSSLRPGFFWDCRHDLVVGKGLTSEAAGLLLNPLVFLLPGWWGRSPFLPISSRG